MRSHPRQIGQNPSVGPAVRRAPLRPSRFHSTHKLTPQGEFAHAEKDTVPFIHAKRELVFPSSFRYLQLRAQKEIEEGSTGLIAMCSWLQVEAAVCLQNDR